MRGHCEKEAEFEVEGKGRKVDMSGEGSFLGKRNRTNRGTEMPEYVVCRRVHGRSVFLEGRVTGGERKELKAQKTSVQTLPYKPVREPGLYSIGR